MFTVFIPGTPISQPRPRLGRNGAYTPDNGIKAWKQKIILLVQNELRKHQVDFTDAVEVTLHFYMPRAKSNKDKNHTKKPDVDNLAKAVLDALTNAGIWIDDTYVCKLYTTKHYENDTYKEGVYIYIDNLLT